jgi:hypothetical protein
MKFKVIPANWRAVGEFRKRFYFQQLDNAAARRYPRGDEEIPPNGF